jgi:hypothetical protein
MLNDNMFSQFAKGESILLEGYLINNEGATSAESDYLSIQLFPGMVIDVNKKDASSVEQATDPVTGRTFIKLSLAENAEIKSSFQLRLARLALSIDYKGVPFSFGQFGVGQVFTTIRKMQPRPPITEPGPNHGYDQIGERDTRSPNAYTGPATVDDREAYFEHVDY